jgi:predicted dehydrogenase
VPVHIGLIGAGNISDTHARAVHEIDDAAVAAVYAPRLARAEALAGRHDAAAYDDLDRFLAHRPMTIVAIGTPSGLHAAHGTAAAQRGLHVLVEKPIDVTTARADAVIGAAERSGVVLGVIFQDRLKPAVRRLKAVVDEGALGKPILAAARIRWFRPTEYYAGSSWRGTRDLDGGGALINQAVHTIDLMLWLFGPVRRVFGCTATRLHAIESEDTAVASLEFESGALGTIEATTAAYPGYSRRLELTGSNGTAILDGDDLVALDIQSGPPRNERRLPDAPRSTSVSAASPVVADASAHRAVFEDFIRAVATGGTPSCDGREGRRSVGLVEAIYRSAATGDCVGVP